MKNKVLYIVLAVLVIGLLGLYIYGKSQTQTPTVSTSSQAQNSASALNSAANSNENANANSATNANTNANTQANTPANNSQGQFSNESDNKSEVRQVVYDGSKFTPSTLTIKVGDTVVFKNASKEPFRVASDPHPSHTNYPEFDSKGPVAAGASFQFIFTKIGSWGYHNHLNASATGTIKVTK